MQSGLLIIGDEILNGNVQDTNSNFAARLLFSNGMPVSTILTVSDTEDAIIAGIAYLFDKVDLMITTGGLGPTKDDVTKTALVSYFNTKLIRDESVYRNLETRFAKRGKTLNELNADQAMVPAIAEVLQNDVGTAPVFWIEQNAKVLITLPGVPSEMRYLLEHVLMERIREHFVPLQIVQKTLHLVGIPESDLAIKIKDAQDMIDTASHENEHYKLAFLPDMGKIRLQITGMGNDKTRLENTVDRFIQSIEKDAGKYIFSYKNESLQEHIGNILREQKATLSTAESCTGGYLAHLITSIPGSSDYYQGSIISYANEVKVKELGVKHETLDKFGAVSEETCREMLNGCLDKFGTSYAIVTTGIAGPGGGTSEKPAGTVWIGVGSNEHQEIRTYRFDRNRMENIHLFAITALDLLRKMSGKW